MNDSSQHNDPTQDATTSAGDPTAYGATASVVDQQAVDQQTVGPRLLDDPELEQLLNDAYAAPPVPRALLGRIDRAVTAEWGESPRLAERSVVRWTAHWQKLVSRGAAVRRVVPLAGTVALLVVLAVVLNSGSRSYAWSSVLDALERQGIVEITSDSETRLLSLTEEVVSVRTPERSRLIDLRRRVLLERQAGAAELLRRRLTDSVQTDRDGLALRFLAGEEATGDHTNGWRQVRVIDEQWDSIRDGGTERIDLRVTFAVSGQEPVTLQLTLDPETCLPLSCATADADIESPAVTLEYPETTIAAVRQREFPTGLTIIELDEHGDRVLVATDNTLDRQPDSGPDGQPQETPNTQITANDRSPEDAVDLPPVVRPTLFDEPSKWPVVEPVTAETAEVVRRVDAVLTELWRQNKITPAELADEEELLRRVYLDLVGRTPGVTEVREWLADKSPQKYEALVDRLLQSPDHASHLATVWRSFLIPEGVDLTAFGGVQEFDRWLAERFASDDSYDEVVRSLLLAEGRLSRSGPLLFYSAVKLDPEQLAARTSRVFLGMRLECAQCHDHPFEPWSQEEFWGFAAFFAQISRPRGDLETVSRVMRVRDVDRGDVMLPDTQTVIAPAFLDGAEMPKEGQTRARRQQLAKWLTGHSNPYFARAAANRVWGQMFGKGIVDPIDDFGTQHTPVSAELLDMLAGHFVGTGFSLRELFRTVALSTAYRRSSGAATDDPRRLELFAQMNVKTLTAEQVYDCITVATLLDSQGPMPAGFNLDRIANASRDQFIQEFKTPAGRTTEYLGGIPQALTLMNGSLISGATGLSTSGLLSSLEAPFFSNEQRIEVLYLATLSRRPRPAEWELLQGYIPQDARGDELREGLADILWALLNSAEFTLNH